MHVSVIGGARGRDAADVASPEGTSKIDMQSAAQDQVNDYKKNWRGTGYRVSVRHHFRDNTYRQHR